MKWLTKTLVVLTCLMPVSGLAADGINEGAVLKFSDGRQIITDLGGINDVLHTVGVHLGQIDVPDQAVPLLRSSMDRSLTSGEITEVLSLFSVSREEMLDQVRLAGRTPVIDGGGSMTSGEAGVPPYPKVYDLRSMGPDDRLGARNKFGRLHVNSTDEEVGVDEVMTLPSGGPWTWYFQIDGGVTVELDMAKVTPGEKAWRLSYPGLTPHGAYFHSEVGLCVAYITGPEVWEMRYEAPGFTPADGLGDNPFIDFSM